MKNCFLDLRDPSESEEIPNRESNLGSQDDDLIENQRNEEGMQDDESDNDFTFNDAETESDSDDNQSNQDAQRSVQTGATVGSETGKMHFTSLFIPFVKIAFVCIFLWYICDILTNMRERIYKSKYIL